MNAEHQQLTDELAALSDPDRMFLLTWLALGAPDQAATGLAMIRAREAARAATHRHASGRPAVPADGDPR